jgi:hypothetical protein
MKFTGLSQNYPGIVARRQQAMIFLYAIEYSALCRYFMVWESGSMHQSDV